MSKSFICDITGKKVKNDDGSNFLVEIKNADIGGVKFNIEVLVNADAWNKAQETHVDPDTWDDIMTVVKDWMVSEYGP